MQVKRCKDQASKSLEYFYARPVSEKGSAMLRLLKALQEYPDSRQVWGLTSHSDLWLLGKDDSNFKQVRIVTGREGYVISYQTWQDNGRWRLLSGTTASEAEAVSMILIAFEHADEWKTQN